MDIYQLIDWDSNNTKILLNPRMPTLERRLMLQCLESIENLIPDHIWLATSGSSAASKCVALSKDAILISAASVNRHLQATQSDVWLNPLPYFHVGGLGIFARGYLSKSPVYSCNFVDNKWDPHAFVEQLKEVNATLTSLVPTQLYDIVSNNLHAPTSVRAVIVGGGALSEQLYNESISRGWKLLPSYGLTECSSQVATAPLGSWDELRYPLLKPLDHVELAKTEEGFLKIKSQSLMTAYVYPNSNRRVTNPIDPKVEGWFITEDNADFVDGSIRSITRESSFVKIGGEGVDLSRLNVILDDIRFALGILEDMAIFAAKDERLGHVIHLAVTADPRCKPLQSLVEEYHAKVLPFEKIRKVWYVDEIPRTPLRKLIRHELSKSLIEG